MELNFHLPIFNRLHIFAYVFFYLAAGVNSFHAFMGGSTNAALQDSDLYKMFRKCKELNAIPMVHAENGSLIEEVWLYMVYSSFSFLSQSYHFLLIIYLIGINFRQNAMYSISAIVTCTCLSRNGARRVWKWK